MSDSLLDVDRVPSVPPTKSVSKYAHLDKVESSIREGSYFSENSQSSPRLSNAVANMCASVLEDATDQLRLLGAGVFPASILQNEDLHDRAMKYFADDPIYDPKTGDTFEEYFRKKKLMKLYYDSTILMEILCQIKNDLRFDKDYASLTNFINHLKCSKKEEEELFSEEKENKASTNALNDALKNEQRNSQKHIRDLNETIAILKDQAEDVLYETLIRQRYVETWEQARISQNEYVCMLRENELVDTINLHKNEIDKESRVNTEILLYIMENQKDLTNATEEWMAKYDKDMENRNIETVVCKEKRIELGAEYRALKEQYEQRQKQIDDYLQFKENKRLEEERIVFCTAYAIKIQAWWRGLMVRRHLGPFSIKKGKGKKGKDAKNKDKGKKK